MLIHSDKLNQCKCGSEEMPDLDSDDMVPTWGVRCYDCKQFQHGKNWDSDGAVKIWNEENQTDHHFILVEKNNKYIKQKHKNL